MGIVTCDWMTVCGTDGGDVVIVGNDGISSVVVGCNTGCCIHSLWSFDSSLQNSACEA